MVWELFESWVRTGVEGIGRVLAVRWSNLSFQNSFSSRRRSAAMSTSNTRSSDSGVGSKDEKRFLLAVIGLKGDAVAGRLLFDARRPPTESFCSVLAVDKS